MRFLVCALLVAGCGSSPTTPNHLKPMDGGDGTTSDMPGDDGGVPGGQDGGNPGGQDGAIPPPPPDGSIGGGATTLRVHYPAGSHKLTVRGGGAPLDWTTGQAMTAGQDDTWTFTTSDLKAPAEWKPLLDDQTWARGPNYHVTPGATVDIWPHFTTTHGKVVTLWASFASNVLPDQRPVYAYLPASYDENTRATYPVVYMHDGQNLFDPNLAFGGNEWRVDETFDAAEARGFCSSSGATGWMAMPLGTDVTQAQGCNGDGDCGAGGACRTFPEAIVIGVGNTQARGYEYTPTSDPSYNNQIGPSGGGDKYLQFLVTELKPQVDKTLRTRADRDSTTIMGSSLGGLISAYAGYKQPMVWGSLGELSPSTWWDNETIVGDVANMKAFPMKPLKVYVDSGDGGAEDDQDGQLETNMLAQTYVGIGYVEGKDFHHVLQQGAQHSEIYWAQRLPGALQFLLGER